MSLTPNSSSISLLTASTHSADALTNSANDTYMNHFVRFQSHYHNQKDGEQHTFNVPNECCLPLTCSQHSSCKFAVARKCQYHRYNLDKAGEISQGEAHTHTDPTCKNQNQVSFDCRLLQCFNTSCILAKDTNGNKCRSVFHFCCYLKMIELAKQANQDFPHIVLNSNNIHKVFDEDDMDRSLLNHVRQSKGSFKLVIPVCSKRCYNQVKHRTDFDGSKPKPVKKTKTSNTDTSFIKFDSDGTDKARSSEKIIVDWITDQNNRNLYYGGTGTNGKTKGNTKYTYHKKIAKLILDENGM